MIKILKYGEVENKEIFARAVPTVNVEDTVADIIKNVRERGDAALLEYTERFDKAALSSLKVTKEEIDEAFSLVEPKFIDILEKAAANIRKYHEKQKRDGFEIKEDNGVIIGQRITPVERAGLYR